MGNRAFLHGNGGGAAGLNYAVVGNPKPASPKKNTFWIDTDQKITSHCFAPAQPARVSDNKNFLVFPYRDTSRTNNGMTYTVGDDGSVTLDGTPTATLYFTLVSIDESMVLPAGIYHLSGCPAGGGEATYNISIGYSYDNWKTTLWVNDYGSGEAFTLGQEAEIRCTIGIQSGVKASGLVFRPQLEAGAAATDFVKGTATGQIWISTGASSGVDFNALKKNGIRVCPLSVTQCIDGVWESKPAQVYQGSEWGDLGGMLYSYGNEYESITGGWGLSTNWLFSSGGKITRNDNSIIFETHLVDEVSYAHAFFRPNNKINLSNAKSVKFVAKFVSLDSTSNPIKLVAKTTDNAKGQDVAAAIGLTASSTEKTFTLPVDTLNGSYYVGLEAGDSHGGKVEILEFKIE